MVSMGRSLRWVTTPVIIMISYLSCPFYALVLHLMEVWGSPRGMYFVTGIVTLLAHSVVIFPTVAEILQRRDFKGWYLDHSIKRIIFWRTTFDCLFAIRCVATRAFMRQVFLPVVKGKDS